MLQRALGSYTLGIRTGMGHGGSMPCQVVLPMALQYWGLGPVYRAFYSCGSWAPGKVG